MYDRRFTSEETFRDTKDLHFDWAFARRTSATRIAGTRCYSSSRWATPC